MRLLVTMLAGLLLFAACATPGYVPVQRGNENVQSPGDGNSSGGPAGDSN
jgi:hypothetical protein